MAPGFYFFAPGRIFREIVSVCIDNDNLRNDRLKIILERARNFSVMLKMAWYRASRAWYRCYRDIELQRKCA